MNRKTAFTVIEVLVTVVTAAVLLAVLLPASALVRRSAKDAQCQMNMRQLGVCFDMYTKDNNTFFTDGIRTTNPPSSAGAIGDWLAWLDGGYKPESPLTQAQIDQTKDLHRGLSYLKDYRLLACPMAPAATMTVPAKFRAWGGGPGFEDMGVSGNSYLPYNGSAIGGYAFNAWCNNPPPTVTIRFTAYQTAYCWRTTAVENASEVGVLADSLRWAFNPRAIDTPPQYDGDGGGGTFNEMPRVCIDRHDGAVNVLYMDWSVRRAPLKTLWNIKWHRNWENEVGQAGGTPAWPLWMRDF